MHMAWVRAVCGRLKSRLPILEYGIVYNNFPWPQNPTDKQKQAIEAAAQGVLDARAHYPEASLAALYDPLTMPPELVRAHQKLDGAVEAAYGKRKFAGDRERLAFLFELYQQLASPLLASKKSGKGKVKSGKGKERRGGAWKGIQAQPRRAGKRSASRLLIRGVENF